MWSGMTDGERGVAIFTFGYVAAATAWFLTNGNYEFVVYVITMVILIGLVGGSLRFVQYPTSMLWALSVWGLAHMAGGGVPLNGSVLYNWVIWPVIMTENIQILKYDQVVHAYGFGVSAWVLWHLLTSHFPETRGTWTAFCLPFFAACGLGATNEIIEFMAVLAVPDTNVGGYFNTALDLCFNAAGALIASLILSRAS
jgi:putative membrane protein